MKKINIPLKDQVVSRDVAPELNAALKKAGIEVVGRYYWYEEEESDYVCLLTRFRNNFYIPSGTELLYTCTLKDFLKDCCTPTYTLPELLEVLPAWIAIYWLHIDKVSVHYLNDKFKALIGFHADHKTNITTAAAKLFIWCVENGYIGGGE